MYYHTCVCHVSVNINYYIDVVFLDFAKAFDKVPFKRLLLKLETLGSTVDWGMVT